MYESSLKCPKCSKIIPEEEFITKNCGCGFRLRINFNYEKLKEKVSQKMLQKRPFSHWRYREFFPIRSYQNIINLGEGGTPLLQSRRLGKEKFGLKNLFFKVETGNPSGSFKDRPISVGVSKGVELGAEVLTAASSGNAAAALATYGARAGKKVIVFVPEHVSEGKLSQLAYLGATVIRVKEEVEGQDPSVTLFQKAYETFKWMPSPSFGPFNPFQFEGTKSLGFELCEQFDWEPPDWVFFATGSGGLLAGTHRGFREFEELDFIHSIPHHIAVQPDECAPIVKGVLKKLSPLKFQDWEKSPHTVAGGLADPHPWDADSALAAIYDSSGTAVAVSEEAILRTQRWLAQYEGIFGEPSGTAGLAGLEQLVESGKVDQSDRVVIPITGVGFKDPKVLLKQISMPPPISPDISELQSILIDNVRS
ncbi:MAG: threonine synthase [Candidatus Heimdallarchaeota archaeon]|nr:MAG: threonine synthase [Candidatus Heimdallarchaeota archaeon]